MVCQLRCSSKLGSLYVPISIFRVVPPVGPRNPVASAEDEGAQGGGGIGNVEASACPGLSRPGSNFVLAAVFDHIEPTQKALGAGREVVRAVAVAVSLKQPARPGSVAPCRVRARPDRWLVASRILPAGVAMPFQANWQRVEIMRNAPNGVSARRYGHEVLR